MSPAASPPFSVLSYALCVRARIMRGRVRNERRLSLSLPHRFFPFRTGDEGSKRASAFATLVCSFDLLFFPWFYKRIKL